MEMVSGVGVLDKVATVWRALERAGSLSLADLTVATGIPRATLHRLAVAMESQGLLRRDPQGEFCLGWWLVSLGHAAENAFPLVALARPILERLRDTTGESVQLYVREADARRCVVSLESTHGLRWIVPEGALLPLSAGSAGHVLDGAPTNKRGWVASVGEREAGVASVSAPVRTRDGAVRAAVSLSGPIERVSVDPGKKYGSAVVDAAGALAALIG